MVVCVSNPDFEFLSPDEAQQPGFSNINTPPNFLGNIEIFYRNGDFYLKFSE